MNNIIKKSNHKYSRSNIILIDIEGDTYYHLLKIEEWFLGCLKKLEEENKLSKYGDSKFVINVLNKDFFGISNEKERIIILFQNGDNPGPLLESTFDMDNIVLMNEYTYDYYIKADDILKILTNEPDFIKKIGVSSVSKKCMNQFWNDMKSNDSLSFKYPVNNIDYIYIYIYEDSKWNKKKLKDTYFIDFSGV